MVHYGKIMDLQEEVILKRQFDSLERRVIRSSIDWSGAGLTLEQFLAGRFTYRSLEEWRERIRTGEILLNGILAEPDQRLELHDSVEYFPGDLPEPEADLNYRIAYEDETLMVIDKPGNLCVHPSGPFFRHTLWHLLSTRFGEIHLVNRLDRETSGLLIVAKNSAAAAKLGRRGWPVRKEYLALVSGRFEQEVDAAGFLVPDTESVVRKKRRFVAGERPPAGAVHPESARTLLAPEEIGERFSLVRATPVTGRLHQIRATLFSLGFPLVGDKLYGVDERFFLKLRSGELTEADREKLILPRQALHSTLLEFRHPVSGETITVKSPFPEEFALVNDAG